MLLIPVFNCYESCYLNLSKTYIIIVFENSTDTCPSSDASIKMMFTDVNFIQFVKSDPVFTANELVLTTVNIYQQSTESFLQTVNKVILCKSVLLNFHLGYYFSVTVSKVNYVEDLTLPKTENWSTLIIVGVVLLLVIILLIILAFWIHSKHSKDPYNLKDTGVEVASIPASYFYNRMNSYYINLPFYKSVEFKFEEEQKLKLRPLSAKEVKMIEPLIAEVK